MGFALTDPHHFEWELISNQKSSSPADDLGRSLHNDILDGKYPHVLSKSSPAQFLFGDLAADASQKHTIVSEISSTLARRVVQYVQRVDPPHAAQYHVLCVGVASLYSYMQAGWTGPSVTYNAADVLGLPADATLREQVQKSCLRSLTSDGEEPYHLMPDPLMLLVSQIILSECRHLYTELKTASFWKYRVLFTQQRVLENPSASLMKTIFDSLSEALNLLPPLNSSNREIHARVNLEFGLAYHWYHQDKESKEKLKAAQEAYGLSWSLSGALGKRTRFQTFDVAQLVVLAENTNIDDAEGKSESQSAPVNMALNDDTLLENVQFSKQDESSAANEAPSQTSDVGRAADPAKQHKLNVLDQCILLAHCLNVKNMNPLHGLTREEMGAFVAKILENSNNWMVHTMGLLLRSRLESNKGRTVERSVLQIQKELGDLYMSIGVVRSALEIFERLEMWESAVSCYQLMEKDKQAEDLILRLLEERPDSPKFLCLLGDVKKDISYYEKAWEASNGRYARAMRSLGAHYFQLGEYQQSLDCYQKALEMNPLFDKAWYVMGCAAMRLENWDVSAKAFSRVVSLDFENGEAWTNLSSIYIRQQRKRDAWRALREALKSMFDNFKIWENYLYVSTDLGEFAEAIHAMRRLVDLRFDRYNEKHKIVDIEVLNIFVDSVIDDTKDANGEPASKLASKVTSLINLINSKISTIPEVYRASARLNQHLGKLRVALDDRLKAYRIWLNNANLTHDQKVFEQASIYAQELVDAYVELGPQKEVTRMGEDGGEEVVCKDWAYQARMTLRTLIGRTRESFEDTPSHMKLHEKMTVLKSL
ncbi:hypothetical protein HK102_001903 [Quaeritorhiza haematococci]|nr:hypothetical protein HK102_001903 [Quaeritorhiza haematococci]